MARPVSSDSPAATGARGALNRFGSATFSSLKNPNYRLYFIGQLVSLTGTWMQGVAQAWLVLELTGSAAMLGIVTAVQFLPVLALAPYGGLIADRFSKRRLLLITQSAAAVLALTLGTLVATHTVTLWMVFVLALGLGVINALDNPTRQSFIHEMVGGEDLRNAVTLNAIVVNVSRVIGPALAGVIIAWLGLALCFLLNGLSFVAVIACLALMTGSALHRSEPVKAAKGQLREGFAYVRDTPVLRDTLVVMAIVGTLTFEFQVTLPALARFTFHGQASVLASLMAAMGVGAVIGGLAVAGRRTVHRSSLVLASFAFGASVLLVALAPSLPLAIAGMVLVGACSTPFTSLTNAILQSRAEGRMRGRVMSLWTVAFLGSTLVGAPIVGFVAQRWDPRWGLAVGGCAALVAGAYGLYRLRAAPSPTAAHSPVAEPPLPTATIAQREE